MKLALDYNFIGFVTNEAWNKLANLQCPKYSGTVCSLIPSPKDLSKGRKLNKVKINQVYNQNMIIKAFVYYKEAFVKEALDQVLLCNKGKSTARCQTEKWNPAGEAVFGAKRNQHAEMQVNCWRMERVFGAELQSVSALHLAQTEGACGLESMLIKQLWSHTKSLQATSYQGFTPVVLTAGPFASFTIWSTGVSLPRCGKLKSTKDA